MISYAQNLEDIVLNRAFQNKPKGFYIDVGAHDPVELSVTKLFYDLGWLGINIEPVAKSYEKFEINRPDDINLNIALGAKHDFLGIYEIENHPEYTSMNKKIAEASGKLTGSKVLKSTIEVRTLKEVCDQHCDSFIDFIKIDVEGFEQQVILGADFTKYRPTMIVVEATNPCKGVIEDWDNIEAEAAWHDWEPLLFESKYLLVYYDGLNRYYLRKEDEHLKKYFAIPITLIQDDFTVYSAVKEIDILKSNNIKLEERTIALREQFEKVSEKCSSLNDLCEQNDLKFKKLSKENDLLIKDNTKLKNEKQKIKNELSDRKKENKSLKACLAKNELNLKQALEDKNKLEDEIKQIEGEIRDRKKEFESLKTILSETELKLKLAERDKNNLNIQNQNVAKENRQILNEFHKIKNDHKILNACINQKTLQSKQKKWLRLFDHFQFFFQIKENLKITEFKTNIKVSNPAFETEIAKENAYQESYINLPSIFPHIWEKISNVFRDEIVKKGYEFVLETEKFFHLEFSFPTKEWIGICYIPFELPNWLINTKAYFPYSKWLTSNEAWIAAKTNCNSLIAFSNDHAEKIQSKTGIKSNVIKIPNYEISEKWTWEAFESNSEKSIVQVGWWLMRMHAIYCLPDSGYNKVWIYYPDNKTDDVFNHEREYLKKRNLFYDFREESVVVNNHLSAKEYAGKMCSNIAFIHYYDVSVPDFVLECIARNTPILVNPLPAVREYLGDEYPLYYYFYNDAVAKAEDKKLVKNAHEYLCHLASKTISSEAEIRTQIHNF